jgi:hypothetical protein
MVMFDMIDPNNASTTAGVQAPAEQQALQGEYPIVAENQNDAHVQFALCTNA